MDFAEDAKEACLKKIRAQHQSAIVKVFDFVGPEVSNSVTRVTHGELGLKDELVFGPLNSPVASIDVWTESEIYTDHVRFITKYRLKADGETIDFTHKGFNVKNPKEI